MSEHIPPPYNPELSLYEARDELTKLYDTAQQLFVEEQTDESLAASPNSFYSLQVQFLSARMNRVIDKVGGIFVAHQEETFNEAGTPTGTRVTETPIWGCSIDPSTGILSGKLRTEVATIDFTPGNIVVDDGSYTPYSRQTDPSNVTELARKEARHQHMIEVLKKELPHPKPNLRRIK